MKVYPKSDFSKLSSPSHPVFKFVESRFWYWINNAPKDIRDMYFSEDAINDKKGAIQAAIENAIQEADESRMPVDLVKFDLEVAFE